jgi:lipopolysaccharide/colanic/teichoic acid biosynthesis glycosyltransferase
MSWAEKLAHDLEYVADRSVRLYLRVVGTTFLRVVRQSGGRSGASSPSRARQRQ